MNLTLLTFIISILIILISILTSIFFGNNKRDIGLSIGTIGLGLTLFLYVFGILTGANHIKQNLINAEKYYSIELINNLNQDNKTISLKDQNGELIELYNEYKFKVNEMVEDGKIIHTYKTNNPEVKLAFYMIHHGSDYKFENVYYVNSKTLISIFK